MKNKRIPIIYEDKDIIVIDKPAGLLSISTDKRNEIEHTAYRVFNEYVKKKHKSNKIWIVHRLDRDTSGVMMFAKSEKVKLILQDNWEDMAIEREYVAVVEGKMKLPSETSNGRIESWLKQNKNFVVYSSNQKGDGKLAITNYKVINTSRKYSLLDISLETGRKNQIRVHMKDIGYPIIGDKKYGAATNPLNRLGLHASALTIKHPISKEPIRFEAAIPNCFTAMFG